MSRILALFPILVLLVGCGQNPTTGPQSEPGGTPLKNPSPNIAPPKGRPNNPPTGGKESEPPGPATPVTAEALSQAFVNSKGAVEEKFTGQWLLVEGKVLTVFDDSEDARKVFVKLVGVRDSLIHRFIMCQVRAEALTGIWELSPGQTVQIEGRCIGGLRGWIDLKLCRIVRKGPDPAVATTAADLVANYSKNPSEANAKYRDKQMTIAGAYFVSADQFSATFSVSAEDHKIRLMVVPERDNREKFERLKPGQIVNFKAECNGPRGEILEFDRAYIVP